MGGWSSGLAVAVPFLIASASLQAQVENKPFLEEERRREMDERARANADLYQPFLWDFGGWLHSEVVNLEDPPQKSERTLRYVDVRLWGEARLHRRYRAYVRLQVEFTDFNSGDQFEGNDDDRFRAHVDQGYLEADWSSPDNELIFRLGKEFLTLGRGLLYNNVAYGLQGSYTSGRFSLQGFLAHTIIHDDDIDQSLTNSDDSRRAFFGIEADYRIGGTNRAYVMAMVEKDLNDEDPSVAVVDWTYDANYIGAGARGGLVGDFGYAVEGVFEFGSSVAAASTQEESIRAFALLLTIDYTPGGKLSPYLALEYMYGSGDEDRQSVTDQLFGNEAGTDDEGFLAFGFVQTGFALFPRLSNLHILRFGGSIRPLAATALFEKLEVGAYFYHYRKVEENGVISDPGADEPDSDVGNEIDVFLRWRILSDVGVSVNYGHFMPGSAYSDDDPRDFVSAGITYSF